MEFENDPSIEVSAEDSDIRRFIDGQLYRLPNCIRRDPHLQNTVKDGIVRAVGGMFLLAILYTDSLLDKRTKSKVEATLKTFDKGSMGLDKAYDDVIHRIDSQLEGDRDLAKMAITWIVKAKRPLRFKELRHALSVEPGDDDLDLDNIPDLEDIISVCAGLVVADERSNVVRLVHYTTQEYLERIQDDWNKNGPLKIASTCLAYLSYQAFPLRNHIESGLPSSTAWKMAYMAHLIRRYSLVKYAASYWIEHVRPVLDALSGQIFEMLRSRRITSHTALACGLYHWQRDDQKCTGLHLLAFLGALDISERFFTAHSQDAYDALFMKDLEGHTPIYLAAYMGHTELLVFLLAKAAEANAKDAMIPAIHGAVSGRRKDTTQFVLEKIKDLSKADCDLGSLLGIALWRDASALAWHRGSSDLSQIVRMLLDHGARVDGTFLPGQIPALQMAIFYLETEMVKVLLEYGADVNSRDRHGFTALHCVIHASTTAWSSELSDDNSRIHWAIWLVQSLLDHAFDLNAEGREGDAALLAIFGSSSKMLSQNKSNIPVLRPRHLEVAYNLLPLLLAHGAKVNHPNNARENALPLVMFSVIDPLREVELLLGYGAEVNARDQDGNTPLQLALQNRPDKEWCSPGRFGTPMCLIMIGGKLNADGRGYKNALSTAMESGYQPLLDFVSNKEGSMI